MGSVNSLKYYITLWSDLCGTSDEWDHISIVWSMMHMCHLLWQKIDGTLKRNRCSHNRPVFLLNILRNTTEKNISHILIFTKKKLKMWGKDRQEILLPLNFLDMVTYLGVAYFILHTLHFSGWRRTTNTRRLNSLSAKIRSQSRHIVYVQVIQITCTST